MHNKHVEESLELLATDGEKLVYKVGFIDGVREPVMDRAVNNQSLV